MKLLYTIFLTVALFGLHHEVVSKETRECADGDKPVYFYLDNTNDDYCEEIAKECKGELKDFGVCTFEKKKD